MQLTNRTILIVDDNPDDRFFMRKALERVAPGMDAQYLGSGNEAVAYLTGQGNYSDRVHFAFPAFVITDLEMANGDGFSVLRQLQQTPLTNEHCVMMLSSSYDAEDVRRAHQLGAASYRGKPCGYAGLCDLLAAFFKDCLPTDLSAADGTPPAMASDALPRRSNCGLATQ